MRSLSARIVIGGTLGAAAVILWLAFATRGETRVARAVPTPLALAPEVDPELMESELARPAAREELEPVREPARVGPVAALPDATPPEQLFLGRVFDGRTGLPLEGVEVHWRERLEPAPAPCEREPVTRSDARGEFRVRRRGSAAWLVYPERAPLAFVAQPPRILVHALDGSPAVKPSDAELRELRSKPLVPFPGKPSSATHTSALETVAVDDAALFPPQSSVEDVRELEPDPEHVFAFELWPPAALTVELVGPYDAPCRWMRVELREVVDDAAPGVATLAQVTYDGRLDDGRRMLFPAVRAHVPHRILLGGSELEQVVVLAPGEQRVERVRCGFVALSGRVTDPSGGALADARVETRGLRVQTDEDGAFGFASLGPGRHELEAHTADGRWALREQVELVDAPVDVVLRLEPVLEGR